MPEQTMIEKVARAIYRDRYGSEPDEDRWLEESEQRREDFRGHARAAIAAMREPTEEMIEAGARRIGWSHGRFPERLTKAELTELTVREDAAISTNLSAHASHTWKSMINFALSQSTTHTG